MPRRGLRLALPGDVSRELSIEYAELADEEGVDTIWVPEGMGRDSSVLMTQLSRRIESAAIGSGIFVNYGRTPAQMAMTAAAVSEVCPTQFKLGIGTSGPARVEGYHGVPFERPLRRTREYIEIIDAFLSGEEVEYDGEFFDVSGFDLGTGRSYDVPIYVAAMGPKNLQLTGEFADGWLPLLVAKDGLDNAIEQVEWGAERRRRSIDDIDIAPYIITCISESAPEEGRDAARSLIAFYVGAMGDFYYRTLCDFGYAEQADAIRKAWRAGDHDAARSAVSDDLLSSFAICGTPAEADRLIEEYGERGVDEVVAYVPPRAPDRLIRETISHL